MENMIEASGLTLSYGTTRALDGVDLTAPAGTVLGVLGPNGAGRTTAVRVLATLLRADAGTGRICGHDVATEPDRVRQLIGLTGQYASVDEDLTGRQNLVMIGRLLGLPRPSRTPPRGQRDVRRSRRRDPVPGSSANSPEASTRE